MKGESDEGREKSRKGKKILGAIGSRIKARKGNKNLEKCMSISSDDAPSTKKRDEDVNDKHKTKQGETYDDADVNPPDQDDEIQNLSSGMDMHGHPTSVFGNP